MKALLSTLILFAGSSSLALAAESVDYLRDVKPILAQHCYSCHGVEKQKGGLRADTAAALREGGEHGPAVRAGKSADSLLYKAVIGAEGVKPMPQKQARLTPAEIAILKQWIDQGAPAPAHEKVETARPSAMSHWAFQTPTRPALPAVKDTAWVRNPIDAYILARLEKEGLRPAPEADRVTLIRRLTLDLLGLPPTPEEVDEFLADVRPDAYERLVERLLQSPHYGERWGRHWLDMARYADSNGFTIDAPRLIWKYRDWVIEALNRDMPFDQFTIKQLAGDLLPEATVEDRIATGFHRNTLLNEEGGIDPEQFRVERTIDRANTTGSVFLGLTVGCAQCHDHKFDPLKQSEYYSLYAFFNSVDEPSLEVPAPGQLEQRAKVRARIAALEKRLKGLDASSLEQMLDWEHQLTTADRETFPAAIQALLRLPENGRTPKQVQELLTFYRRIDTTRCALGGFGDQRGILAAANLQATLLHSTVEKQIAELKKQEPVIVTTLVLAERKPPRESFVQIKGDFLRKGAKVTPGVPAWLPALPAGAPSRLDLARWLVDPKNPLTARVTVNRFWMQHFGAGLVETDNDFGTQGTPPSHPELLDWLATEFIARQWSMKAMHRLIVTSATYRQSSKVRPELATVDPRNRLLARQNRLRMEAETVRDLALASSGLLTPKLGGPSVFPPQPEGVYRFTQVPRDWKVSTGPDRYRRGMYTYFWRSAPYPWLTVFDAPDSTTTCTRRNRSNTPLQALTLLNDQAAFELAQALAQRVLSEPGVEEGSDGERLERMFRLCLSRKPSAFECRRLGQLLNQERVEFQQTPEEARKLAPATLPPHTAASEAAAWVTLARVLLNVDEFITRE